MGSGGLIVMDEDTCMVDLARYFMEFIQEESCGKCTPCRQGTRIMLNILERICQGKGKMEDLDILEELSYQIKETALCGLGQTAPNPILSTLKYFREEGLTAVLVIVGEGPYRPVIEEKVQGLGLAEQVRLVGHQEWIPDWLALMDAFVLASYAHEGVPQALLQALAMGKPVVATRTGGIPEVILPEETGLLAPARDSQALAQAMSRLARDASLREKFSQQGPQVASRYSLDRMADALEALYAEITPVDPLPTSTPQVLVR